MTVTAKPTPEDIAAAEKLAAEKAAAEKAALDQAPAKAGKPEPGETKVLSTAKRDGKTVRVLTDGVRTWKESK